MISSDMSSTMRIAMLMGEAKTDCDVSLASRVVSALRDGGHEVATSIWR